MGCEMGRSLRGFASVVVSAIMTRALLLLGRYNSCERRKVCLAVAGLVIESSLNRGPRPPLESIILLPLQDINQSSLITTI